MIVVMKIWFRIGVRESGTQTSAKHSLSDTKRRLFCPLTLLALTSIYEAGRVSRVCSLQPGGFSGTLRSLAPSDSFRTPPVTKKSLEIESFFAKWAPTSNRFCAKNRSCSKQRVKPCLTGARTHIRDFGFPAHSL